MGILRVDYPDIMDLSMPNAGQGNTRTSTCRWLSPTPSWRKWPRGENFPVDQPPDQSPGRARSTPGNLFGANCRLRLVLRGTGRDLH